MVIKNLFRRKVRTILSILGAGVGISLMVAIFTMADDMLGQLRDITSTARGDLYAINTGGDDFDSSITLVENGKNIIDELRAIPEVKAVHPHMWAHFRIEKQVGSSGQLNYFGVTSNSPAIREMTAVETCKPGQPLIDDNDPDGFVMGRRLFDLVNAHLPPEDQLKVGEKVPLQRLLLSQVADYVLTAEEREDFEDMGTIERTTLAMTKLKQAGVNPLAALGMKNGYLRAVAASRYSLNEFTIFFPLVRVQQLKSMEDSVNYLFIELHDAGSAAKDRVAADLNTRFPRLVIKRSDSMVDSYKEVQLLEKFAWGLSIVAAIAGALGVLNTMLLSVLERTRELGLLLAVGWSRMRIARMVLLEGVVIMTLGGLVGSLFGYLQVLALREILSLYMLNPRLDPVLVLKALGLAVGLGLLAGLYPAIRAARLSPMDALRHE